MHVLYVCLFICCWLPPTWLSRGLPRAAKLSSRVGHDWMTDLYLMEKYSLLYKTYEHLKISLVMWRCVLMPCLCGINLKALGFFWLNEFHMKIRLDYCPDKAAVPLVVAELVCLCSTISKAKLLVLYAFTLGHSIISVTGYSTCSQMHFYLIEFWLIRKKHSV